MKVIPDDFFNGHDLTDPICMEKIHNFMKVQQDEDEMIIQTLIDQEHSMVITWPQPWYQIEGTLTRPPAIRSGEEMFRTDKLTMEEYRVVDKNWNKFRKLFGIPDKPRCLARIRQHSAVRTVKKIRLFLAQFLAQGLERHLEQVYHHFVRKYAYKDPEHYSEAEHQVIKVCIIHQPEDASTIASYVLAREPRCVYRKINELKDNKLLDLVKYSLKKKVDFTKRNKWDLKLATKFLHSLIKHSGLPLEELKHQTFPREMWQKIEAEMNSKAEYIKHFWYSRLHVQLFVQTELKRNKLIKKVFKRLRELGYRRWKDIDWNDLALNHFPDGVTGPFLYRLSLRSLETFREGLKMDLDEVYTYMLDNKAFKSKVNFRVKLLKLNENGELVLREIKQ